jgi:hypothetical protein
MPGQQTPLEIGKSLIQSQASSSECSRSWSGGKGFFKPTALEEE